MSIVRKIEIDGQDVLFKASAAIPRIYRLKFQRDIYKDLRILERASVRGMRKTPTSICSHWRCSRLSLTRWQNTPTHRFQTRWMSAGWFQHIFHLPSIATIDRTVGIECKDGCGS